MNCTKCGADIMTGAKYCYACGEKVNNIDEKNDNNTDTTASNIGEVLKSKPSGRISDGIENSLRSVRKKTRVVYKILKILIPAAILLIIGLYIYDYRHEQENEKFFHDLTIKNAQESYERNVFKKENMFGTYLGECYSNDAPCRPLRTGEDSIIISNNKIRISYTTLYGRASHDMNIDKILKNPENIYTGILKCRAEGNENIKVLFYHYEDNYSLQYVDTNGLVVQYELKKIN